MGAKKQRGYLCRMNKAIENMVGENIRRIRTEKKITQDELAAKLQIRGCDITRSAVAKIEVGQRHLYPDEIILIKEILNTTYDSILFVDNIDVILSETANCNSV